MSAAEATPTTRERIVDAADTLFYQRGFEKTSFADIADAVSLSRGNFYYHFRTKDDILAAVIALRSVRTQSMLTSWTRDAATPSDRLRCFAEMLVRNRRDIQRYGCPVGTLCAELSKLDHPAQSDAGMIFGQFRDWLRTQFNELGQAPRADELALHLLARSQGVATLASTFHDEAFIQREVALMAEWLDTFVPHPVAAKRPKRKTAS